MNAVLNAVWDVAATATIDVYRPGIILTPDEFEFQRKIVVFLFPMKLFLYMHLAKWKHTMAFLLSK